MVVLFSVIVGISFGVHYGDFTNQMTYLVSGMRLADPGFLANDWWATQTVHYHQRFAYLVAPLHYLDILPWGLAVINVTCVALVAWMLFVMIHAMSASRAIWAWLIVLLVFFLFYRTRSVGGTYLIDFAAQPSTLGAVFLMGAATAFVLGRYALSGLLLGAAGLFHTNYLLLGFPFFGLAHLILGRSRLFIRGAWQFAPALIVFAFELPNILYVMGLDLPPQARAAANSILIDFRAAHHHKPMTFLTEYLDLGGWALMGLAFLPNFSTETNPSRRFTSLFLSGLGLVALATALTTFVFITPVSRLFVWRLAPFVLMFAMVIFTLAALRPVIEPSPKHPPRHWRMLLAAAGMVLVIIQYDVKYNLHPSLYTTVPLPVPLLIFGGLIAALWGIQSWAVKTSVLNTFYMRFRSLALTLLALVIVAGTVYSANPAQFNLLHESRDHKINRELFDWTRGTDSDSLFLTPPSFNVFRLYAGRAIVVDAKNPPFRPDEILEWYHRLEVVNGGKILLTTNELILGSGIDRGYNSLTETSLDNIVRAYGVDYAVFQKATAGAALPKDIVFQNDKYVVFRLQRMDQTGMTQTGPARKGL